MIEDKYTSLELSKKLAEAGCELKSKYFVIGRDYYPNHCWYNNNGKIELTDDPIYNEDYDKEPIVLCPAFDILNDICCKYADVFFNTHEIVPYTTQKGSCIINAVLYCTSNILRLLQQGKKQEAEYYIWEHCLFNPKNKE